MCGIAACLTAGPALDFLLPALRQLEYRGYDSAGVAVHTDGGDVVRIRAIGRLSALSDLVAAHSGPTLNGVGIGHTRWATHGGVTVANAHPHTDCAGAVHVVHNGIIDNAEVLRARLVSAGHLLATDVDSEVVAHLVEDELRSTAVLAEAVHRVAALLHGSWALAVTRRGERSVVVTAFHSPLAVALGEDGCYGASDVTALAGVASRVQVLRDGDCAVLRRDSIEWFGGLGAANPPPVVPAPRRADVGMGAFQDFMDKEITEQPAAVARLLSRLTGGIANGELWTQLRLPAFRRVRFVACGTSLNAARALANLLACTGGIPSTVAPASELASAVLEPDTLCVALSQSGETADVLRALDDRRPLAVLAITNTVESTLGRRADAVVDLGVGVEMGVAASKTFTAQVVAGSAVFLSAMAAIGRIAATDAAHFARDLDAVAGRLAYADLSARAHIPGLAPTLLEQPGFLYVSRGSGMPYAAEGALKLKELSYRWVECDPAGELKHGPIALIEQGTPVVVVDNGNPKLAGNVAEMRARGARIIAVGGPDSSIPCRTSSADPAPWGPLEAVIPLQHLAREIALGLGRDVDKPRNLAKSVTVE
ncbi:MAG: glucosamine--fructose-6-phosphate aminotransferase, isomerizing [Frankiales bacterium]|nr:glucosamine--fructose-6-phosphate aminotransferase, isomerizing [Frankiales bacterium]